MAFWKRSMAPKEVGFDVTYRFETSWILPPGLLFFLRALFSLYAFTTIFFEYGWNGSHDMSQEIGRSFSYFTNLTYWGLTFYMLVSAVHTWSYWRTGTPFLARWPRFLQHAHSVFYSTITIFPWIVTIVYWALLFKSGLSVFSLWSNTSKHALNSFYALFEIVFPRTEPLPFLHIIPIVILLAMYLGLAYVTFETQGFFVYSFLDTRTNSSGIVAAYIVGILVAAVVIFLIVRYLILLRCWWTEKKLGMIGKFSRRRGASTLVDDEVEKGIYLHDLSGR